MRTQNQTIFCDVTWRQPGPSGPSTGQPKGSVISGLKFYAQQNVDPFGPLSDTADAHNALYRECNLSNTNLLGLKRCTGVPLVITESQIGQLSQQLVGPFWTHSSPFEANNGRNVHSWAEKEARGSFSYHINLICWLFITTYSPILIETISWPTWPFGRPNYCFLGQKGSFW